MNMLKNKVILVTGCNRGIGKSIVETFLKNGAIVYANARTEGSLNELQRSFKNKLFPLYFDIRDVNKIRDAILTIKKEHQKLDVLVNNAALTNNKLLGTITRNEMQCLFETNVMAVIDMIQYAIKIMPEGSSIINISSIVGQKGNSGQLLYSATKGAVISLTKSAAKELAKKGIRVNSVAPGLTKTDRIKDISNNFLEMRIKNIPYGRMAQPKEIADACLFFASDLSIYISGEILGVNGAAIM